jgi:uracil-DNA glycosylase
MPLNFDPGYISEPFLTLCAQAPDATVYPYAAFRTEWGPIFHRGRLDGSARVLCIGQDPAEHEAVVRRILVGTAGHRGQGFLAKLGINRSYVLVNTFLYSVYGQTGGTQHINDPQITQYRNQWIAALISTASIEVVVAFGGLADQAWQAFLAVPANAPSKNLPYQHVPHPTSPEGAGGTPAKIKAATKAMLANWNQAIQTLRPAIKHPDTTSPFVPYGSDFLAAELPGIPAFDLPAGTPAWMQGASGWAVRTGTTAALKRRTISVEVPTGVIP